MSQYSGSFNHTLCRSGTTTSDLGAKETDHAGYGSFTRFAAARCRFVNDVNEPLVMHASENVEHLVVVDKRFRTVRLRTVLGL